ncbi:MAG: right-handed parallel beta-helix repeat-containing protein [Candidatus Thorarchaeota archaeon]
MKHAKGILLIFTFLFVFGSMNITGNDMMVFHEDMGITSPSGIMLSAYTTHGVINIYNDSHFEDVATSESWAGDGSETTPYIIQGYNITEDIVPSIYIEDISLYFEIRDCLITSPTHVIAGGVRLINVTHAHLEDNIISYKNTGLEIDNSDGVSVVNCTMDNNAQAASVESSNHTSFEDCYFTNTTTGSGFYMDSSHWTEVINCEIMNNGDYAVQIYGSDHATFSENEVSYNMYNGFYAEDSDYGVYERNIVYGHTDEGFYQTQAFNLTLTENTVYDNDRYGIYVSTVDQVSIIGNTVYNNTLDGISFDGGSYGIIALNDVYDNGWTNFHLGATASGIDVQYFDNCTVINNQVHNNSLHGIYFANAPDCSIESNTVYDNHGVYGECGIYVYYSDFCEITGNTVYNNTDNGIYLDSSTDCTISYNIVYDNTDTGLLIDDSNRTLVYYNDFGWNGQNAHSSVGSTYINYWDNGVVGNWWSDFGGTVPYNISGPTNEQDLHPANSLVVGTVSDLEYELGSTGNTLFMAAQALNPGYYEITVGTALPRTVEWDGENIYADIDDLSVGMYSVSMEVYHVSGHSLSHSATVTVVDTASPEWVATPIDQTIEVGEALSYQVQVTEFSDFSWIVNDTLHFTINDGLITNSTVLEVGDYGLNVTVVDFYGNTLTAMITIHVVPATIPPPPGGGVGLLLAVGGGAAALVVIVLLVVVTKKRGT